MLMSGLIFGIYVILWQSLYCFSFTNMFVNSHFVVLLLPVYVCWIYLDGWMCGWLWAWVSISATGSLPVCLSKHVFEPVFLSLDVSLNIKDVDVYFRRQLFRKQTACQYIAGHNSFPNIAYNKPVNGPDSQTYTGITDGNDYQIEWVINRAWDFVALDFGSSETLGLIRVKFKPQIRTYKLCWMAFIGWLWPK